MSRSVALALMATTAVGGAASAASAETYNWSGFHVGVHAGRDWSKADWAPFNEQIIQVSGVTVPATTTGAGRGPITVAPTSVAYPLTSARERSGTWGVQGGWSGQSGSWVFGVEGDVDGRRKQGVASADLVIRDTLLESSRQITISREFESRWSWSARGRIGYAWDRWLVYATGGLAGAQMRVTGTDTYVGGGPGLRGCFNPDNTPCFSLTVTSVINNVSSGSVSKSRLGWTLGGGLDLAVTNRASLGFEYRHTDLGRSAFAIPDGLTTSGAIVVNALNASPAGLLPPTPASGPTGPTPQAIPNQTPVRFADDQVTLRLNIHFGGSSQSEPDPGWMGGTASAYNWTGFYIGAHAGDDWRQARTDPFNTPIANASGAFIPGRGIVIVPGTTRPGPDEPLKDDRGVIGGQGGFVYQWGGAVLGVEGDIDGPGKVGTATRSTLLPLTAISAEALVTDSRTMQSRWAWAVVGRVGFAWDRMQLYGVGGGAGAKLRVTGRGVFDNPGGDAAFACTPAGTACSPQTTNGPYVNTTGGSVELNRTGWTAGGGAELALLDWLSVGLEYRHTDLGRATYNVPSDPIGALSPGVYTAPAGATAGFGGQVFMVPVTYRYRDDAVSVRVNIRFGRSIGG